MNRNFTFAVPDATILRNLCPISKPSGHSGENAWLRTPTLPHFRLRECCNRRLPATQRSTDRSLAGIVMFLALSRYTQPRCSNGGGTPNHWIRPSIAANNSCGTVTSAIWNVTYLEWPTNFLDQPVKLVTMNPTLGNSPPCTRSLPVSVDIRCRPPSRRQVKFSS